VIVAPDEVQAFLDPLPVERLWGVGRVAGQGLHQLGAHTIAQLHRLPLATLRDRFGSSGEHLWELAQGRDDRPVVPDHEAKSISHETTFAVDIDDPETLRAWLLELTDQVARRLRRHGLRARTVHVKVRLADFRLVTRSATLPGPTHATGELWSAAIALLDAWLAETRRPVRLLGMGASGLAAGDQMQMQLFDQPEHARQSRLDDVTDAIRDRFGAGAIRRAGTLNREHR
jgi:DNA polymerase-4